MMNETQLMTRPPQLDSGKLEPMLIRLPPSLATRLRRLAQATRIRQSDYLREAVSDLLAKYQHLGLEEGSQASGG